MSQSTNRTQPAAVTLDEPVVADAPLIIRRIVKFGETDAAGVVYTGRFLDYALEAFDTWLRLVLDLPWPEQAALGIGTPAVSCQLEFARPLRAGDRLDVEVLLDRIGGGSFTVRTTGRNAAQEQVFSATMIFASIAMESRTPVRIPDRLREKMTAYAEACDREEKA